MKNDIKFMPLGGGQEIGASWYYLNIGGAQLLLDCGKSISRYYSYGPDFSLLAKYKSLKSKINYNICFLNEARNYNGRKKKIWC